MAVLNPVKVIIDNYPVGQVEYMEVPNNQENPELGTRKVPFTKELYIERDDFMIDPPKKYFRMFPGNEVRLMNAYFVTCTDYKTDESGEVTEIHCTYDPETRGGNFEGRKVKGTIHWVSASEGKQVQGRLYENIVDEEKGVYNEEDGSINDIYRIDYLTKHINQCYKLIEEGYPLFGYCPWSFLYVVSSHEGFNKRYGLVYVDRTNRDAKSCARIKKNSFYWYKNVIKNNGFKRE